MKSANIGDIVHSVLVMIPYFGFGVMLQIILTPHFVSHKNNTDCSSLKIYLKKEIKARGNYCPGVASVNT